jgi:hypothetical protein
MAHKNKRRGNKWQMDGVRWWARLFNLIPYIGNEKQDSFDVATTSLMSKGLDNFKKVDIWFNRETVDKHILRIQDQRKEQLSKGKTTSIKLDGLFNIKKSPGDIPMLFTRVTRPPKSGGKRVYIDKEVVTMNVEDFEEIVVDWYLFQLLKDIPENELIDKVYYINKVLSYELT